MPISATIAQDIAEVLRGLAALAWPAVVAFFLHTFRSEIVALLKRLRRVRTPAGELELDRALDSLQEQTEAAAERLPPGAPAKEEDEEEAQEAIAPRVLGEARRSPRLALMELAAEIERRSREVLASSQEPRTWERRSLGQRLRRLDLSPDVRAAAMQFQHVRNQIVHGHEASEEEVLRAIDLGLAILDAIDRIPHEVHYVREPWVDLFADAEGRTPYPHGHGVLLESVGPGREEPIVRPFPTTRTHFEKGKAVAWEWGDGRFPEAWYRDPDDGQIKYAWTRSLEFVGRHLDDI